MSTNLRGAYRDHVLLYDTNIKANFQVIEKRDMYTWSIQNNCPT